MARVYVRKESTHPAGAQLADELVHCLAPESTQVRVGRYGTAPLINIIAYNPAGASAS